VSDSNPISSSLSHLGTPAVPWGPDVDEYHSIDDVGYVRKDVSGQQQFEELELLGSEFSEQEGLASASGPVSSHQDDDYDEGSKNSEGQQDEGEEGEGSSEGGEGVASLSETEDLGTRTQQQLQHQRGASSVQSPASSTVELQPQGVAGASSIDPTWDLGPQDIKLTEPVSTPSKGSGDQQQLAGEPSRPVLSRVESLSSSLKDFDGERGHEAMESTASERVSRAHSESEPQPAAEVGGGEVIDFNPIPLAEATPQDLKAFGLEGKQQGQAEGQQLKATGTSSMAVNVSSRTKPPPEAKEAGAIESSKRSGPSSDSREDSKSCKQPKEGSDAR